MSPKQTSRADTDRLELPQRCSRAQRRRRADEVAETRDAYAFDHSWTGYPPCIERLPLREIPPKGVIKLIESGFYLEKSKLEQWLHHATDRVLHLGREEEPFAEYTALYDAETLPEIGRTGRWKYDAVFAEQRLNGMYPWFIERLVELEPFRETFPISDERLSGLLPPGVTLEGLCEEGRLYVVSQPSLEAAKPAHGHVMTAPTTLFYVSNLGQLLPIAIQLYPATSDTNPIFTPNDDPGTWLAVKIHAACADTLVHSIYSHAVLMHFVMCNVWTAANRTLPSTHPIHAFLEPHFWSTLFVTNAVKSSMDKPNGSQCEVYGTGLEGQDSMVARLYRDFDFSRYIPSVDFAARGVDDPDKLPGFHYRDDALALWDIDLHYVERMMGLFYESDEDVRQDEELQAWVHEMASASGAGIRGLPTGESGRIETRTQLFLLLTCVLFTVTSRHSSIENGALEYLYVPANPFLYRLDPPRVAGAKLSLRQVADELPPIDQAIRSYALIATADFDPEEFGQLGRYEEDFTQGWPEAAATAVDDWKNALKELSAAIHVRNEKLETPYSALDPRRTFNSIWN